ncbi:hypothetical protein EXIGLDRAFT_718824 [Exidia glandulosa HHB12029]|uniref:Uncharacterized protein n=1 Tax=Exidia glandulosa HHB12029 TaxID=1314781 RepID=A0A165HFD2_EXIGL|nr:hypothetical protein EXIGLDRAFT_718824 [Exidia glandulosa HHB12029]
MSTPPSTPPPSSPSPPPVTPPRSTRLLVSLSAPPGAPSARPNRFLRTPDRQRVLSYVRPGMAASAQYQAALQESQAPAPHPPPPLGPLTLGPAIVLRPAQPQDTQCPFPPCCAECRSPFPSMYDLGLHLCFTHRVWDMEEEEAGQAGVSQYAYRVALSLARRGSF